MTSSPEGHADALVEHPPHRQLNYTALEYPLCKLIELCHGAQILREARALELRIDSTQIIALEGTVGSHATTQESTAQSSVTEGRDLVGEGIRENLGLDAALE